jgi:hypothetical protein
MDQQKAWMKRRTRWQKRDEPCVIYGTSYFENQFVEGLISVNHLHWHSQQIVRSAPFMSYRCTPKRYPSSGKFATRVELQEAALWLRVRWSSEMQYEGPYFMYRGRRRATAGGRLTCRGGEVMTLSKDGYHHFGDLMGEVGGRKYWLQSSVLHNLLGSQNQKTKKEVRLLDLDRRTPQGCIEEGCLLFYG